MINNLKKPRIISEKHLDYIRSLNCCACGALPNSDPHHLNIERGMGMTAPDNYTVPLCRSCHSDVHEGGSKNQEFWFEVRGIDDHFQYALDLWRGSPAYRDAGLCDFGRKVKAKAKLPTVAMFGTVGSGWKKKMNGRVVKR